MDNTNKDNPHIEVPREVFQSPDGSIHSQSQTTVIDPSPTPFAQVVGHHHQREKSEEEGIVSVLSLTGDNNITCQPLNGERDGDYPPELIHSLPFSRINEIGASASSLSINSKSAPLGRKSTVRDKWRRAIRRVKAIVRWQRIQKDLSLYGSGNVYMKDEHLKKYLESKQRKAEEHEENELKGIPICIITPDSTFHNMWSNLMLALMFYTAIVMPLRIVFFDDVASLTWMIIEISIDVIFVVDVFINSITSFYDENDQLITSRKQIFFKYAKTWLILDVIACFPYTLVMTATGYESEDNGTNTTSTGDFAYFLRLLKLPRVYRPIIKLSRFSLKVSRFLRSDRILGFQDALSYSAKLIRLVVFIVILLVFTHLIACTWFFLSKIQGFPPDCWVVRSNVLELSKGNQYLWSLYWAVQTLTTVGYGDVVPLNKTEEWFCIAWMISGAISFTFVISSIANLLTSLETRKSVLAHKLNYVNEFSRDANIEPELKSKMKYSILYNSNRGIQTVEEKQALFDDFHPSLKYEVAMNMNGGFLKQIPFFKIKGVTFISRVFPLLESISFMATDYIFKKNEHPYANFLLDYTDYVYKSFVNYSYFGEIEIILKKKRISSCKARGNCDFLTLDKKYYNTVIKHEFPDVRDEMERIAYTRNQKIMECIQKARELINSGLYMEKNEGPEMSQDMVKHIDRYKESKDYIRNIKLISGVTMGKSLQAPQEPPKQLLRTSTVTGSKLKEEEQGGGKTVLKRSVTIQHPKGDFKGHRFGVAEKRTEEKRENSNSGDIPLTPSSSSEKKKSSESSSSSEFDIWGGMEMENPMIPQEMGTPRSGRKTSSRRDAISSPRSASSLRTPLSPPISTRRHHKLGGARGSSSKIGTGSFSSKASFWSGSGDDRPRTPRTPGSPGSPGTPRTPVAKGKEGYNSPNAPNVPKVGNIPKVPYVPGRRSGEMKRRKSSFYREAVQSGYCSASNTPRKMRRSLRKNSGLRSQLKLVGKEQKRGVVTAAPVAIAHKTRNMRRAQRRNTLHVEGGHMFMGIGERVGGSQGLGQGSHIEEATVNKQINTLNRGSARRATRSTHFQLPPSAPSAPSDQETENIKPPPLIRTIRRENTVAGVVKGTERRHTLFTHFPFPITILNTDESDIEEPSRGVINNPPMLYPYKLDNTQQVDNIIQRKDQIIVKSQTEDVISVLPSNSQNSRQKIPKLHVQIPPRNLDIQPTVIKLENGGRQPFHRYFVRHTNNILLKHRNQTLNFGHGDTLHIPPNKQSLLSGVFSMENHRIDHTLGELKIKIKTLKREYNSKNIDKTLSIITSQIAFITEALEKMKKEEKIGGSGAVNLSEQAADNSFLSDLEDYCNHSYTKVYNIDK